MSDRAPAIALGLAACVGLMAAALRNQRRHPKMRIHFSDHDSYPNTPHLASLPEGPRTAADANILGRLGADGSMVTKEDLLARVWSRLHVSEEYLKTKISALRKTFGKDRHFIRTEIGPGYRFTVVGWRPPGRRPRARWMSVLQSFSRCFHANVDLSTPSRSRLFKALALMAALGLSTVAPAHAAPGAGSSIVQGLYDALLGTMKNGRTLGESGRFAQLAPVIRRSFDVALMARLSVGPLWAGLSEAQRQALTESYGRYISAIYADRFDSYHGQKLEVTGE